jgi:hypothetical protein
MADDDTDPAGAAASDSSSEAVMWDVAEILAERTSVSGENEVLVVWKPSWIPKSNLQSDGPVLQQYSGSYKWKFSSACGAMRLFLPVEPGTSLAADCATIKADMLADSAAPYHGRRTKKHKSDRPRTGASGAAQATTEGSAADPFDQERAQSAKQVYRTLLGPRKQLSK